MKAIMYGAGNIGRGFIGPVFAESGYELIFIDVAEKVVSLLQREKRYPLRILDGAGAYRDRWIEGVSAVDGRDIEAAACCIAAADLMATAVGVRALPFIAPVIAAGLRKRFALPFRPPLNIIICENLIGADRLLKKLITENLSEGERDLFEKRVGLVEASIGRMVPVQTEAMQEGNPLMVSTEAYRFLPLDRTAMVGEAPRLEGMVLCDNFDFYLQRKLFVHNMGHAISAYLGMYLEDTYIAQAIGRTEVLFVVQNAMQESALALSAQFGVPPEDLFDHIGDLLCRFANRQLADTCARVGADTERKLGAHDRLIGAIHCCTNQGHVPAFCFIGAAAALYRHIAGKGQEQTAAAELERVSGLGKDTPEGTWILTLHDMLVRGEGIPALIDTALRIKRKECV
jgi:mannitol-1-phosphate 5-dehydrogenase